MQIKNIIFNVIQIQWKETRCSAVREKAGNWLDREKSGDLKSGQGKFREIFLNFFSSPVTYKVE